MIDDYRTVEVEDFGFFETIDQAQEAMTKAPKGSTCEVKGRIYIKIGKTIKPVSRVYFGERKND